MANEKEYDKDVRRVLRRKVKRLFWWGIVLAVVVATLYLVVSAERLPPSEFESTAGLHYHPRILITINGEKITVPNNIGIGVTHNPIHTHEEGDGTIHLEFDGQVRKDDIRLGDFFAVWNKEWTATSFMGLPIGGGHTLAMKVDGAPSTEYGNLLMQDKQLIELVYQ